MLTLASASPRRKQLLKEYKIPFRVMPSRIHEPPPGKLSPAAYTKKLALAKAIAVAKKVKTGWVLGADTIVVHEGDILGKPANLAGGRAMLGRLQGTTHRVVTGVALVNAKTGKKKIAHRISRVTMRKLTPAEIARYAKKNLDKSGCYAAQQKKDPVIKKVNGSYSNVVGLPMELVTKFLKAV
jgi:septum formation protein